MKKLARNLFVISLSIILILSFLFTGCAQTPSQLGQPPATISPGNTTEPVPPAGPVPEPPESAPSGLVKARLTMSSSPLLEKPVQITATFTVNQKAQKDIQDLDIEFILPEGFQLVEGSLTGKVKVLPDTPSQYQVTIKAVKTGIWQINVRALYPWPDFIGGKGSAIGYLYANISETGAEVSDVPLGPKIGHGSPDTSPPKGWVPPP